MKRHCSTACAGAKPYISASRAQAAVKLETLIVSDAWFLTCMLRNPFFLIMPGLVADNPVFATQPEVSSGLIKPFVARLTRDKRRHEVEHRCRKSRGPCKGLRRADQRVDLHGAAEFVVLQDRRLVIGGRHRAG